MRKVKEVLRLRYELGLGQRQIARSCSLGLGTVHDYLSRAERASMKWPLPEDWDEARVVAELFSSATPPTRGPDKELPDFAAIQEQRQKHRHLTLQLLWEEYRQVHPEGYLYSRFCELYQRWRRTQDVVLRQEYKAGEKMFVDWAGATIPIYSRAGGEPEQAHLFVAVLGASSAEPHTVLLSQLLVKVLHVEVEVLVPVQLQHRCHRCIATRLGLGWRLR